VASLQNGVEPRAYFEGASVDQTGARSDASLDKWEEVTLESPKGTEKVEHVFKIMMR
jgi:hypothetical protein